MTYADYGYNQQAWDSEYDSTWEDDEEDVQPKTERASHQYNSQKRAARDLQDYRHGYPDALPKPNLLFYQNKIPFEPRGEYIDMMHKCWCNDYDMLEHNHNFIQWLFPLQERGVNQCATPLTEREIQLMKSDEEVMKRLLESYKLMLGFYGIVLLDPNTGKVARAKENWKDRFKNLNNNTHNNLRITRILKCLGEMGYERFQAPLVRFFLKETLYYGNLPNVKQSALNYFMFTVKDKKQRQNLVHFAWVHYKPQDRFIWGPVEKLQKLNPPPESAEQDSDGDSSEELKTSMTPSKNDSSEGSYAVVVARREPKNERELGLLRKTVDFVWRQFLLYRLLNFVLAFFPSVRPFIDWYRGDSRNEVKSNEEQISAKTEGTRTEKITAADMATVNMSVESKGRSENFTKSEHESFLKDSGREKRHKADFKEPNGSADVKTDSSVDESKTEAKLETGGNGSKRESISEDGTESADKKPLVNIEMPENRQAEEHNGTENEDDSRNFTKGKCVMKLDEGQNSENDRLEGAEEGSVKEDNAAGNGEVSDAYTKDSETDNRSGGREHGGTEIANAGNQTEETKIYIGNSEDEDASKVKLVPLFSGEGDDAEKAKIIKLEDHRETSTVWSGDNDGGNIGTQNTLLQTDKTDLVERNNDKAEDEEAANVKLSPQFREVGDDEISGISKIEDSLVTMVLGSGDNDGGKVGAQHTLPKTDKTEQVERNNDKAKDKEATNVKLSPQFGEGDDEISGISKIEDSLVTMFLGSEDNDGGNVGAQNTLPETDKTEQVDRDDGKTKDEEAANVKLSPQFGEEGDEDNPRINKIEDNRGTLVLGSGDNDGGNIGAQNILPETDKANQCKRDVGVTKDKEAANVKPSPHFGKEGDDNENPGINEIEDNRGTLVLGPENNDGRNIGAQNTLPGTDKTDQVDRDDGKTKDEEAVNVKLSPHFGEGDEDENPGINKIEDNRGTLVLGSGENDRDNIGAQNTLPGTEKTDQVDRYDGKTKDEEAANVKLSPLFGDEGDEYENPNISKIEDNRGALVLGSGDNNAENIGTQILEPEKDKS